MSNDGRFDGKSRILKKPLTTPSSSGIRSEIVWHFAGQHETEACCVCRTSLFGQIDDLCRTGGQVRLPVIEESCCPLPRCPLRPQ